MTKKTQAKIGQRIVPRTRAALSRSSVRKLSIESLEHRCPMDAAGMAAGFGEFAIIGSERVTAAVTAPAITCYAEEYLRLPQSMPTQRIEHEAFPDPGRAGSRGDWQGPRLPEDTISLQPETPAVDFTGDGKQKPPTGASEPALPAPDPVEPVVDRSVYDLGDGLWRPDPVRFSAPQLPAGSIGLDARLDADGGVRTAGGFGSRALGVAQRGMGSFAAAAGRWQIGERSEMSLSRTRYFDSSDLDSGLSANLQGETSSLLAFTHQGMSEEAGIAIGNAGSSDSDHRAAAIDDLAARHRARAVFQPPMFRENQDLTLTSRSQIRAHEADVAILSLVSVRQDAGLTVGNGPLAAVDFETPLPWDESAQSTRVAATGQGEADLQPGAWQQTADLLADVSHWAVVGLLLSNHLSNSFIHSRERLVHRLRGVIRRAE